VLCVQIAWSGVEGGTGPGAGTEQESLEQGSRLVEFYNTVLRCADRILGGEGSIGPGSGTDRETQGGHHGVHQGTHVGAREGHALRRREQALDCECYATGHGVACMRSHKCSRSQGQCASAIGIDDHRTIPPLVQW